jgi:hypothetical protein
MGAVHDRDGWRYDVRHSPPRGRSPLAFFARVVPAPDEIAALAKGVSRVSSLLTPLERHERRLRAPALGLDSLSPLATPVLVFTELTGSEPSRPDSVCAGAAAMPAADLFWWMVCTDSCEAVHAGVLLTLRRLSGMHASEVAIADDRGVPLVAWGMHTAERVLPFERLVKVSRADVRVTTAGSEVHLESPPVAPASHGGAMHQLVWMRAADGRETVCDFTGCQYGVRESLGPTRTPFWSCDVSDGGVALRRTYGFELHGEPASFLPNAPLPSIFDNQLHTVISTWIRDSAIGVIGNHLAAAAAGQRLYF